jgi:acyl-coenzyme A thioesterase PaaI-like protein
MSFGKLKTPSLKVNGPDLLRAWSYFGTSALGRKLFSRALGVVVPYTGSVGATVEELERGRAVVSLRDRRAVRNHLASVHAVALANLGEFSTGLALISGLGVTSRAILKGLEIEYLKKARGRLEARAQVDPVEDASETREPTIVGEIRDSAGDVVARVHARWLVGPK